MYERSWKDEQPYQKSMRRSVNELIAVCVVGVFVFAYMFLSSCEQQHGGTAQAQYKTHLSNEEAQYAAVFTKFKSPAPVEMAIAVNKTKNPPLMAALAIVESSGDPKAVGDSGKSRGAFQVQEHHWGEVGSTASEQALQSERILEELMRDDRRGRLRSGLEKYNTGRVGTKAGRRYVRKVMEVKREMSKMLRRV